MEDFKFHNSPFLIPHSHFRIAPYAFLPASLLPAYLFGGVWRAELLLSLFYRYHQNIRKIYD
jgi:hypothetical protein